MVLVGLSQKSILFSKKITLSAEAEVKWQCDYQVPDENAKYVLECTAAGQVLAQVALLIGVHWICLF